MPPPTESATHEPELQPPRPRRATRRTAAWHCLRHGQALRRPSRPDLALSASLRFEVPLRDQRKNRSLLASPLPGPTRPARLPDQAAAMEREGQAMRWLAKLLRRRHPPRQWLAPTDLLHDRAYRRLWTSILISSIGGQVTMLALPLTAAVLLHASPTQMGLLTTMELLPFVLLSLPAGVWLDRVRKLPIYIAGELTIGVVVASVPLAWWAGWLSIHWLYVCGFVIGTVYTIAGSAAQIVLTQVVARDRLVEAHAKNVLASSGAEVAGPGIAGALIRLVGAPLALLVDAVLVTISAAILRGIHVHEPPREPRAGSSPARRFWADLKAVSYTHLRAHETDSY